MSKGHAEGNLNFVAIWNGWERQISLTPTEVANMSYLTLESLLELDTLKLSSQNLRIFVEHPPSSGIFNKVCPWQEDGTLQSTLVKSFFEERMRTGTVTTLDVRDTRDERDGPAPSSRNPKAKGWLKATGLVRKKSHSHGLHAMGAAMNEPPELPNLKGSGTAPKLPPKSSEVMLSPPSTPDEERCQSQTGYNRDEIVKSAEKVTQWQKAANNAQNGTTAGAASKYVNRESFVHGVECARTFSPISSRTFSPVPTVDSYSTVIKVTRRQLKEDVKPGACPPYATLNSTSSDGSDPYTQDRSGVKPVRMAYARQSIEFPQEVSGCSDSDSEY
ncbi:hypothetical protein K435DRAFT_849754 [Dendrothele bispora CBS 962.96]|uniref:Uncharacterized protein n=1 Tax=Dendrothele bispora (strain CBS 962.96) TaxID=1314807 RepID=A0A4S8MTP8_DENBC|nr:hypothetical protein K435DRAFT_849754 [Dendrothele bispora CBS 962.96]